LGRTSGRKKTVSEKIEFISIAMKKAGKEVKQAWNGNLDPRIRKGRGKKRTSQLRKGISSL